MLSSELDQTSVGVTVVPVVVFVVGNAGLVNPAGTLGGSLMLIEMLATSPGFTTNRGAEPETPFDAVAVRVAMPSEIPMATPVTGSSVATNGSLLDQMKFAGAGVPSAAT